MKTRIGFWAILIAVAIALGLAGEWQTQRRIALWKTLATANEASRDRWMGVAGEAAKWAAKERNEARDRLLGARKETAQARAEVARLRRLLTRCQAKEAVQTEWVHHLQVAGLVPECRGVPLGASP